MSELFDMAKAAHLAGDAERAIHGYRLAIEADPADTKAMHNLATLLQGRRQNETALLLWRRAAEIAPHDEDLQISLARSLVIARRYEEARAVFSCLPCNRIGADVLHAQGLRAHLYGDMRRAIGFYNEALTADPNWLQAKWDRCLALLSLGDYTAAWPDFDTCLQVFPQRRECLEKPMPLWKGEDLSGKRLWIYNEQGLGDCIAYARFLRILARHGAPHVTLDVNRELFRFFDAQQKSARLELRPLGVPPPVADYQIPLGLLMSRMEVQLDDINGEPYLTVPQIKAWPVADTFSVGICWASGANTAEGHRRNIPFMEMAALAANPKIRLYSFQVGQPSGDLRRHGAEALVTDLSPWLIDYAATAANLARMDVLVTCDTSIAHCAGALGVKTLLLTPADCSWIWHARQGSQSDWYDSVEIYVQEQPDDEGRAEWTVTLSRAAARIAELVDM